MKKVNSSLISIRSRRSLRIIIILVIVCAGLAGEQWSASAARRTVSFFGFILGSSYDEAAKETSKESTSPISLYENRAEVLPLSFLQSSATRATVKHGFNLNGRIEGSVQQLLGENTILNSSAVLTGDLLVLGSPNLVRNGTSTFGGTVVGTGSSQPSNYSITLNSGSQLGRLLTRTNAVPMPTVAAPPAPTGTRNVTVNSSSQSIGDFATLRNLTLNSSVGNKAIPPGTYGTFIANSGSGFILGIAGATQPAVYNFTSLTLNSGSQLQVVGPVMITLNSGMTLNASTGSSSNPGWLQMKVASGGVTLNSGSALYGSIIAPSGTVTVNSRLEGNVTADRLLVNSGAVLKIIQQGDTTPPAISVQQPVDGLVTNAAQVTVSGTYSDESQTTITVNGTPATIQGNTFTATVMLNEGSNNISIQATDAAGNQTSSNRTVTRTGDYSPPKVSITSPAGVSIVNSTQFEVVGTVSDALQTVVELNGTVVPLENNTFRTTVALSEGDNTVIVQATDAVGNRGSATATIIRDTSAPELNVVRPAENQAVNSPAIIGSVNERLGVTVKVNNTLVDLGDDGSSFQRELAVAEGTVQVRVVATDNVGNSSEVVRNFIYDKTPPVIFDVSPVENAEIDPPATISGRVTDSTTVRVSVNGVDATVQSNGQFTASNVPVVQTKGEVEIVATDAADNIARAFFAYKIKDRNPPPGPTIFPVISPTRLSFQTIEGRAEPGSVIEVTGGASSALVRAAQGTGLFAVNVGLQEGTNLIGVTASDSEANRSATTQVTIESNPTMPLPQAGQPFQINISTGNSQKGLREVEMPRPLIVIVTDVNGEPVPGVAVEFRKLQGDGRFVAGGNTVISTSDNRGYASAGYINGATPGPQQISANFAGNSQTLSTFVLETLDSGSGGTTSISGLVTDQNLRALPNVLVRIGGQQTRTGTDGRFLLSNVSTGPHQILELIGRDQVPLPGRWPNISYDMDVLPGVNNDLGRPLFLPRVNEGVNLPLSSANIVTQDTAVEMPVVGGGAPVKVVAKAGTRVTFPSDVTDKRFSVTKIATNRVPMTLEDGLATNLYISVQPSGAVFDPPLEVSFPNVDGLAANSEVLLMSFDHDAGRYVRVGTGHVSPDGNIVKSDPGNGIHVGAWHALPPPTPQPEVTVLGHVQIEGNPIFDSKVILNSEAWVEGARAVPLFSLPSGGEDEPPVSNTSSAMALPRLDYRATFPLPQNRSGVPAKMESTTQTAQVAAASASWARINAHIVADANNSSELRMYADKETLTSVGDMTTVKVKATITPKVKGAVVYFKSYDLDDPSSDDPALDSTPTPNTGDDNRGTLPKPGKLSSVAGPVGTNGIAKGITNQNGEATVTLKVAPNPGNNYRVVASTKSNYLQSLVVKGIDIEESSGAPLADGKANELLTIWRRVHIERDSMAAPTAQEIKKNQITGNIVGLEGLLNIATQAKLAVDATSKAIDDGSPLIDGSNSVNAPCDSAMPDSNGDARKTLPCAGRFQKGTITIGTGAQAIDVGDLSGNGAGFIQKSPEVDITVTGQPGLGAGGNLISITNSPATGTPTQSIIKIYLTYGQLTNIPAGSQVTIAGITATVASTNNAAQTITTNAPVNLASIPAANGLLIPFKISATGQTDVVGNLISLTDFVAGSVTKSNFELKITAGTLSNSFVGGQIDIAGVAAEVEFVDAAKNIIRTKTQVKLPFVLSDDDVYQGLPLLPDISEFEDIYETAYILVVDDGGGNQTFNKTNVPFNPFFEETGSNTLINGLTATNGFESLPNRKDDFWIIYLQTAFQGFSYRTSTRRGDGDPDSEIPTSVGGVAPGFVGQANMGAYGFIETVRDRNVQNYGRPMSRTFLHESGHEWDLRDCYPVTNPNQPPSTPCPIPDDLMGSGIDSASPKFSPKDLDMIRKSVKGPGR